MILHNQDIPGAEVRGDIGIVHRVRLCRHLHIRGGFAYASPRNQPIPPPHFREFHLREDRVEADGVAVVLIGVETGGEHVPVICQHERAGRRVPRQPRRGGYGGLGIRRRCGPCSCRRQGPKPDDDNRGRQSPACHGAAAGPAKRPIRSAGQRCRTEQEEDRPVFDEAPRLERQDEQRELKEHQRQLVGPKRPGRSQTGDETRAPDDDQRRGHFEQHPCVKWAPFAAGFNRRAQPGLKELCVQERHIGGRIGMNHEATSHSRRNGGSALQPLTRGSFDDDAGRQHGNRQ